MTSALGLPSSELFPLNVAIIGWTLIRNTEGNKPDTVKKQGSLVAGSPGVKSAPGASYKCPILHGTEQCC